MTAAGKGLLTLLSEELTPMVKRTVCNPQIAGNLGTRLVCGFHQLNRFQFELFRKRSLSLLHGLFPSWRMSTSSSLPSPLSRVKTKEREVSTWDAPFFFSINQGDRVGSPCFPYHSHQVPPLPTQTSTNHHDTGHPV